MAAARRALYSSERHRSARCRTTLDWDGGWVEQATGFDPGRWSPRSRGAIESRVARQSRTHGVAQMAVRWAASDRERRCGSLVAWHLRSGPTTPTVRELALRFEAVRSMSGAQFEVFTADLFTALGHQAVVLGGAGDQGV